MIRRTIALAASVCLVTSSCSSDASDISVSGDAPAETTLSATATDDQAAPDQSGASTTTATVEASLFVEAGPYDVGVMTLDLGARQAEVWYPADAGAETEVFDTLSVFPDDLRDFIPAELSGAYDTGAYRDADVAEDFAAPAPLVIFSHGFGGFRQTSTDYTTHLASYGFIVASTDHLERGLAAQATGTLGEGDQDVLDVRNTIAAVEADPVLGPLVDDTRVAITGHSAGAGTAATVAAEDIIDGYVSISGWAPETVAQKPALIVIAELDGVVPPERSYDLFARLESDATLINIGQAGHNSFTDSCQGIVDQGGLSSLTDVIGAEQVTRGENGCTEAFLSPRDAQAVLNHYSVAFLFTLFDVGDASLADAGDELGVALADYQSKP